MHLQPAHEKNAGTLAIAEKRALQKGVGQRPLAQDTVGSAHRLLSI